MVSRNEICISSLIHLQGFHKDIIVYFRDFSMDVAGKIDKLRHKFHVDSSGRSAPGIYVYA